LPDSIFQPQTDYLVDPLSIANLYPLEEIFANPAIEKVFHAVDYDVYGLNRDYGFSINNLFDTMIAARTLGYTSLGLGNLLNEKFGIELNKRFQKADWGQRPLPEDLIDYARLDTHYLLDLRDALDAELRQKGRWELAHEDFLRASQVNGHNGDPRERWQRISGQQDLTAASKPSCTNSAWPASELPKNSTARSSRLLTTGICWPWPRQPRKKYPNWANWAFQSARFTDSDAPCSMPSSADKTFAGARRRNRTHARCGSQPLAAIKILAQASRRTNWKSNQT
jgi:hypothetical protein